MRSTKLKEFPDRAYPCCECQSECRAYVREYTTGIEYWLFCVECGTHGLEGIPKSIIGELGIPHSVLSKWLANLVQDYPIIGESEDIFTL